MSYTVKELEDAVYDSEEGWGGVRYADIDDLPGIGTVEVLDSYGGEGQGDELWVVFNVTNSEGSRTWRKSGWYASYSGSDWDGDLEEVVARPKVITEWVKL